MVHGTRSDPALQPHSWESLESTTMFHKLTVISFILHGMLSLSQQRNSLFAPLEIDQA